MTPAQLTAEQKQVVVDKMREMLPLYQHIDMWMSIMVQFGGGREMAMVKKLDGMVRDKSLVSLSPHL